MQDAETLALIRRWVDEIWNEGRYDRLNDFHPAVFDNHGRPSNPAEARQWHVQMRATFPDLHYMIDDLFASGDQVALRWTASGTQRGDLWDMIPATNRRVHWSGMHMLHISSGRIDAVWAVSDSVWMLRQLGVSLRP